MKFTSEESRCFPGYSYLQAYGEVVGGLIPTQLVETVVEALNGISADEWDTLIDQRDHEANGPQD